VETLFNGEYFELRIDHSCLKYLFEQPTLNSREAKWLEFLREYDFDIKHIKGKQNKVVDALRRRVHLMHATTITMHSSYLKSIILYVVIDQHYLHVKESLQHENVHHKFKEYKMK
jgi:hypothetical protein